MGPCVRLAAAAIQEAYDDDASKLAAAMVSIGNLGQCMQIAYHFLELIVGDSGRHADTVQRFSAATSDGSLAAPAPTSPASGRE